MGGGGGAEESSPLVLSAKACYQYQLIIIQLILVFIFGNDEAAFAYCFYINCGKYIYVEISGNGS